MSTVSRITCPHCGAGLKSPRNLAAGKPVKCLKCQAPFTITSADVGNQAAKADSQAVQGWGFLAAEPGVAARSNGSQVTAAVKAFPLPTPLPAEPAPPRPPRRSHAALVCGMLGLVVAGATAAYFLLAEEPDASNDSIAQGDVSPSPRSPDPPRIKRRPASAAKTPDIDAPEDQPERKVERPSPQPATPPKDKDPAGTAKDSRPVESPSTPVEAAHKTAVPAHPEQAHIDRAIDRGVEFVHKGHKDWLGKEVENTVGYAALPGLTLLECGKKTDDRVVQKVADYVRHPDRVAELQTTYDLSLAILFLDRLGDKKDKALIQKLALRLVSGQTPAGGWDYKCRHILTPEQDTQFLNFLKATRPQAHLFNPVAKPDKEQRKLPQAKEPQAGDKPNDANLIQEMPDFLRKVPVVRYHGNARPKVLPRTTRDDHSNSQFAMLALWAARRHDVPTERALSLAEQRFQAYQNKADGGWGYMIGLKSTPSMTCVGLLGLALGHGSSDEGLLIAARKAKKEELPNVAKGDPAIANGLKALAAHIGTQDAKKAKKPPMANLYFLWSVERVGVLYNLPTIGGKDWYDWGVGILLPHQKEDGSWLSAPYPGHPNDPAIDTCLALLFLQRSNLVQDLTDNLMFYMAIPDPGKKK